MKDLKDLKLKSKKELIGLDTAWLKKEYNEAQKKLFTLKMKLELNELKQTHLIKFLRKYLAAINTIAVSNNFNIG